MFGVRLDCQEAWHDSCLWWYHNLPFADLERLWVFIAPFGKRHDRWVEAKGLELFIQCISFDHL